jgi:hypothetical protein
VLTPSEGARIGLQFTSLAGGDGLVGLDGGHRWLETSR